MATFLVGDGFMANVIVYKVTKKHRDTIVELLFKKAFYVGLFIYP
jgi:hypothetical protein